MSSKNRFGLSRDIPVGVKRQVRKKCGFGCTICASIIVEYNHYDPQWKDAQTHNPAKICLLCPTCHSLYTSGVYDDDFIRDYHRNPETKRLGEGKAPFRLAKGDISLFLGANQINIQHEFLRVNNTPMIWFDKPECEGSPVRFNASFYLKGHQLVRIVQNELVVRPLDDFDVECKSTWLKISDRGKVIFLMDHEGSRNIRIGALDLCYGSTPFRLCDDGYFKVGGLELRADGLITLETGGHFNLEAPDWKP